MKTYYIIRTYDLIGATLHSYKAINFDEIANVKTDGNIIKSVSGYINNELKEYSENRYYSLNDWKKGYDYADKYLPYYATVTEDLPTSCNFEPAVYENCQLMTEKSGGYLQFYHSGTGKILKIAMNSHSYQPIN